MIFLSILIYFSAKKLELIPIITEIVATDSVIQNLIEFQLRLLDGINFENILATEILLSQYLDDLRRLNEFKSISSIPEYLRVLMCMTVRDSSIMISIESNLGNAVARNTQPSYNIEIVDFDIKSLQKLPRYIGEIREHG